MPDRPRRRAEGPSLDEPYEMRAAACARPYDPGNLRPDQRTDRAPIPGREFIAP